MTLDQLIKQLQKIRTEETKDWIVRIWSEDNNQEELSDIETPDNDHSVFPNSILLI